jgi:GR25 family glycosyltransferase involved in LPS biosynthesis
MNYKHGLNNFDVVYYINLEHRKDRLEHIKKELQKTNIEPNKINRINAIYNEKYGIIGCCKSHCLALENFINSEHENCIIFEDDFEFTQEQDVINSLINDVFNNLKFDVLMLSANTQNEEPTSFSFVTKILDSQTLSGYAVSKNFAPTLLENFRESQREIEKHGHPHWYLCFDMWMKKLQPKSEWYCTLPKIGKQKACYSDIEKKITDYGC